MKLLFKNKQRNYPHFQMPNAALKITPNPLNDILMKIPMISKGGRIIGIKGERILKTNLQLLLRSEKYKDTIAEYLQTDNSTSSLLQPWLRKASKFFECIIQANGFLNEVNQISESDKYFRIIQLLKHVKDTHTNLKAFVDVLISSFDGKDDNHVDLVKQVKRFRSQLTRTEKLVVDPMIDHMQWYDNKGFEMSFEGDLCIYQLCFPNINNFSLDISSNEEIINIKGSLKAFNASNRLRFFDGNIIQISIKKYSKTFIGNVTGHFVFFGKQFPLVVNFDQSKLSYYSYVSGIHQMLFGDFNISYTGDIVSIGWKDIVKSINGELTGTKDLQSLVEKLASQTTNYTSSRLRKTQSRKMQAAKDYKFMLSLYQSAKNQAKTKSIEYEMINQKYKDNLLALKREQQTYSSLLQQDAALVLIEKDASKLAKCELEKCNDKCVPIMVCDVCQEQLNIPSQYWKCHQRIENVKTSQMMEVDETCEQTQYSFRTIYTGLFYSFI